MFDINPESYRHHLAEIDRQMKPLSRSLHKTTDRTTLSERIRNVPTALLAVMLILGGIAGGKMH